MRVILTIALLLMSASPALTLPPFDGGGRSGQGPITFVADVGSPLDGQVAAMAPGEWQLIPNSDMSSTLLTKAEHDAIVAGQGGEDFWLISTSVSVLGAWNSAAYDPDGKRWFFMGGGHADYGGNEVYQYDFNTLQWTRLNDPAPLTAQQAGGTYAPASTPISTHSYDSICWDPANQVVWLMMQSAGYNSSLGNSVNPDLQALWHFDPTTLTWTSVAATRNNWSGACTYLYEDEGMFLFNNIRDVYTRFPYFYKVGDLELALNGGAALPNTFNPQGNMFRIPTTASPALRDRIFISSNAVMAEYTVDVGAGTAAQVGTATSIPSLGFNVAEAGYAFNDADELVYIWNGGRETYTWDPLTDTYATIANAASPLAPNDALSGGRIFDKWIYLDYLGVFAGIHSSADGGIWLWKPMSGPAPNLDAATSQTISVSLDGIAPGSTVSLSYREVGDVPWLNGLNMFQSTNAGAQPYSGMVRGLTPDTNYQIRVLANGIPHLLTAATRAIPVVASPGSSNVVNVSTPGELQTALDNAVAGDLITLAAGTYSGTPIINGRNGTAASPITIRGATNFTSILDAGGGTNDGFRIYNSNHIHVDGLKIQNADRGLWIYDWEAGGDGTTGNTVRDNWITNVTIGIYAIGNGGLGPAHDDLYICNNLLEGPNIFGDVSTGTWDDEGIVIVGKGVEVCHNTLSGFGDALGHFRTDFENRGTHWHHNLVLWGGDDGIELDFCSRNCLAELNLLSNGANPISFQAVYDGPAYAIRNVGYNSFRGPLKIKPENFANDGVFVYNNTFINWSFAWLNTSHNPVGMEISNNLFTGDAVEADVLRMDSGSFTNTVINYNAYTYDGSFQVPNLYANFAAYQANSIFGDNAVLLAGETVFVWVTLPVTDFNVYLDPEDANLDFNLHASSSAIDAGKVIPQVTDGFVGAAPDIGACEVGCTLPPYGVQ